MPAELPERLKTSGLYPLSSSDFWRLKAPTEHVDFETADNGAKWHCACCAGKWVWGTEGASRLLVFGQSSLDNVDLDSEGRAFCIFVGQLRPEQDNRFMLLKSNVLAGKLDEGGSSIINKESLLNAVRDS